MCVYIIYEVSFLYIIKSGLRGTLRVCMYGSRIVM